MPKRPPAHIRGDLAESRFAHMVQSQGWVWNRTSAGADYGIDGQVIPVDAETNALDPTPFDVQLKGVASPTLVCNGEFLVLSDVSVDTIEYWQRRSGIRTLLVVWVESEEAL